MKYLAPSEMLIGKFPSNQFLQQYELAEVYWPFCEAVEEGDMKKFEDHLDAQMSALIQSGVFLAVEKLRYLTLRNLVKKVQLSLINDPSLREPEFKEKAHIVPLKMLYKEMQPWDRDLDLNELVCILSNLISQEYIKGQLIFEKKLLVLSRDL